MMNKPPENIPKCPGPCPPSIDFEKAYAFPCEGVFVTLCWAVGLPIFKRRIRDEHESEDHTQEATLFALARWPLVSEPEWPLRARQVRFCEWFASVCCNKSREAVRAYTRRMFNTDGTRRLLAIDDDRSAHDPASTLPAPPEETGLDERDAALVSAVTELPEEEGIPLLLSYFHDVPTEIIALLFGVHRTTIERRMERGLAKLRGKFLDVTIVARMVAHS